MCRLEVATERDYLEERFCFASTWFLYRIFIASKLMTSQSIFQLKRFSQFNWGLPAQGAQQY